MVQSMTGYGRAQAQTALRDIVVEIKAVNHRYLDCYCKMPRNCGFLEEKMKARVVKALSRGKVEIVLSIHGLQSGDVKVSVNHPLIEGYVRALKEIESTYELNRVMTADSVARLPDALLIHKEPEDEEQLWLDVCAVLDEAIAGLCAMRRAEGERLKADLLARAQSVLDMLSGIELALPQMEEAYAARLRKRMEDALADRAVDEGRLLTEIAIFCDRTAITEELVRIKSHIAQFRALLDEREPTGRKLDFLMQELNREVNTIGSKCSDLSISKTVVDLKAEIEKIREQVQNIE